jgi:hypothetical protein
MLSARNGLVFCAVGLGVVGLAGCWVGSSSGGGLSFGGFSSTAGATAGAGAPGSTAGATSGAGATGGDTSGAGAPTSGGGDPSTPGGASTTGGDTSGGAPAGGSGGDTSGGAPAGGAAAGGSSGGGSCPAPTGAHQTTALDRSCWSATASDCAMTTANMDPPSMALDASLTTRFSTGVTMPLETAPFTFQVNMTKPVMIAGVKVFSSNMTDYAPMLEVDVSNDGQTWTPVACGAGASTTDFSFMAVSAQYVRVMQMGSAATGGGSGWWSIYDFNVYGATGTEMACTTMGPGATGATCTTPHTT